jgi:hypothetical protein
MSGFNLSKEGISKFFQEPIQYDFSTDGEFPKLFTNSLPNLTKTQHELFFGKPISEEKHFSPQMDVRPAKLRRSKCIHKSNKNDIYAYSMHAKKLKLNDQFSIPHAYNTNYHAR